MNWLKPLLSIVLLNFFACDFVRENVPGFKKDVKTIFVGKMETIEVESPEDANNVSYIWGLQKRPDGSSVGPEAASDTSNTYSFTPDSVGSYSFAVKVMVAGKEVDDRKYFFRANEDTSRVARVAQSSGDLQQMLGGPAATTTSATAGMPAATMTTVAASLPKAKPKAAPKRASRAKPPVRKTRVRPAAAARRPLPADAVPGHYTIQVNSWTAAKSAQAALRKLQSSGFDAYIQRVWFDDRKEVWWRVRLGNFTSVGEANRVRLALIADYPKAWVDYVRKQQINPR